MDFKKKAAQYIGQAGTEKLEDNGKHITYANVGYTDRNTLTIETNQGVFPIKVPIIGQNLSSFVLDKSQYGVSITMGTSDCCWGYLSGFIIGQDEDGKFGCGMRYAQQLNLNPRDIIPVEMQDKNETGYLVIGSACSGRGIRLIIQAERGRIIEIKDILPTEESSSHFYLERLKVSKKEGISLVEPRRDLTEKLARAGVAMKRTLENLPSYERFTHGDVMKSNVKSNPAMKERYAKSIAEYDLVDQAVFR